MTPAQRKVLQMLAESPLSDISVVVYRVSRPVLQRLSAAGLAKYRPYGKPPSWAITQAGRDALR